MSTVHYLCIVIVILSALFLATLFTLFAAMDRIRSYQRNAKGIRWELLRRVTPVRNNLSGH
jgi:uncharacterized integral membrane protein